MDTILLILLVLLLGGVLAILYLNLKNKPNQENENKEAEEIANLKSEISSLKDTLNNTITAHLVQCRLHLITYQLGLLKI